MPRSRAEDWEGDDDLDSEYNKDGSVKNWAKVRFWTRATFWGLICLFIFLIILGFFAWLIAISVIGVNNDDDWRHSVQNDKQVIKNLKNDFKEYIGLDAASVSLCFSKKFVFHPAPLTTKTSTFDPLNPFQSIERLKEASDPREYLYGGVCDSETGNCNTAENTQTLPSKFYILQGSIKIQKYFPETDIKPGEEENWNNTISVAVSYHFTSNFPTFNAIKLAEVGLDTEVSDYKIKKTHTLCTAEYLSNRRCDGAVGGFYSDYFGSFKTSYYTSSSTTTGKSSNTEKTTTENESGNPVTKQKYLEDQLKGHYDKLPVANKTSSSPPSSSSNTKNGEITENPSMNIKEEMEKELFLLNEIEQSTLYNILFFIPSEYNSKVSHQLGKIAFIIEPTKCK